MNTVSIKIKGRETKVPCPESWDSLPSRALLTYYSVLFTAPGDEFTASAFTSMKLIQIASHLAGINPVFLSEWEQDCRRNNPEYGEAIFYDELRKFVHHMIEGLFDINTNESGATTYACKLNLLTNPYPELLDHYSVKKGKQKTAQLYAPANKLENISIYELGYTFTLFEAYLKTNDPATAHKLLAVLYRPSRPITNRERESAWGGDRRQRLRGFEKKLEERAKRMATLPMLTQRVILFWFASCRQHIINQFPKVFTRDSEEKNNPNYGWGGLLLSIAEGPANLDKIADQNYTTSLTWLSMKADEAERMVPA